MMIPGLQRMEDEMKHAIIAVASFLGALSTVQASPASQGAGSQGTGCVARVLHSEELPYAPIGYWLGKVTLEVIPSSGAPFITTLYHNVPWQRSVPRRGETFGVRCDPASYSHRRFAPA
jgi:hypothetical protein